MADLMTDLLTDLLTDLPTDVRAELADRNLRVNLRGNQNLLIWGHRYYLYTKKTGPYFQKVLQSSKNSHRPSSQSENTKLS